VGGPESPLRIVGMGQRDAEERMDGIADVLLDNAALGGDDCREFGECLVKPALEALRTERHGERRRAHEVNEHGRNNSPLGKPSRHRQSPKGWCGLLGLQRESD
jgi:hypothetical protein